MLLLTVYLDSYQMMRNQNRHWSNSPFHWFWLTEGPYLVNPMYICYCMCKMLFWFAVLCQRVDVATTS